MIRLKFDKSKVEQYVIKQCHKFVESYKDIAKDDADAINYVYNSYAKDIKYDYYGIKENKESFAIWLDAMAKTSHRLLTYKIYDEIDLLSEWTGVNSDKISKAIDDDDVITKKYVDAFIESFYDLYNKSKSNRTNYNKSYDDLNLNDDLGRLDFEYDGNDYTVEISVNDTTPKNAAGYLDSESAADLVLDFEIWSDGELISSQSVTMSSIAKLDIEDEIKYKLYYKILKPIVKDFRLRKEIAYSYDISKKASGSTSVISSIMRSMLHR